jgi:hypothetical protein
MGLQDFILLIDSLGLPGLLLVMAFVSVMIMGALVDIFQFLWVMKRIRSRRRRALLQKLKAQVLQEQLEEFFRSKHPPA